MLKRISYLVRNTFGLSKSETNGFLVLLFIIAIILFLPYGYSMIFKKAYTHSREDQILLNSLLQQLEENKTPPRSEGSEHRIEADESATFGFDPNKASVETFVTLGISQNIAERIIRYREAGGVFRIKRDFKKIYELPPQVYHRLYDFIELPEAISRTSSNRSAPPEKGRELKQYMHKKADSIVLRFDINTADTAKLKEIRGIGDILANRIIKYRDLIGGFVRQNQFNEVYGLNEEVLNHLYEAAYIAPDFAGEEININDDDIKALSSHPYISYSIAKAIHAYRQQHGEFETIEDLRKLHLMDTATLEKIRPYIGL